MKLPRIAPSRIWRVFGLQSRAANNKLPSAPFICRHDARIVANYAEHRSRSMVVCVDEKRQIQGVSRTLAEVLTLYQRRKMTYQVYLQRPASNRVVRPGSKNFVIALSSPSVSGKIMSYWSVADHHSTARWRCITLLSALVKRSDRASTLKRSEIARACTASLCEPPLLTAAEQLGLGEWSKDLR